MHTLSHKLLMHTYSHIHTHALMIDKRDVGCLLYNPSHPVQVPGGLALAFTPREPNFSTSLVNPT